MYIYKRPYVHFPTIFLRQNCDHMCIIKIVFNPLPMKIFWKKLLCIFSFWKIKKVLCILLKSVFCINIYVDPLMFSAKNKWTCNFCQMNCRRDFFTRDLQKKNNQHNIEYKDSILLLLVSWTLKFGMKFGVPGVSFTLMLSYSSFLTQHFLVRPLNLATVTILSHTGSSACPCHSSSIFSHIEWLSSPFSTLFCQPQSVLALGWI